MNFLFLLTLFVTLANAFDIPHFDIGPEDYQHAFGHDDKKFKRGVDCYYSLPAYTCPRQT
jgi:hypothetical protein